MSVTIQTELCAIRSWKITILICNSERKQSENFSVTLVKLQRQTQTKTTRYKIYQKPYMVYAFLRSKDILNLNYSVTLFHQHPKQVNALIYPTHHALLPKPAITAPQMQLFTA